MFLVRNRGDEMPFVEILQTYFRGEKLEAWFFIFPAGLALVALGVVALRESRGGYAWGVAVPCILGGLALVATGVGVGARTDRQVSELLAGYHDAPAQMVEVELPRMERVNANFRSTHVIFGVMAVLGLGFLYGVPKDWALGLGQALVLLAGIGLVVDGFASRRAVPYTEALAALQGESEGS